MSNVVELPKRKTYPPQTVAIFNDGFSVIVVDDHCYCVKNRKDDDWAFSAWIFREAIDALRDLPDDPDEAKPINAQ